MHILSVFSEEHVVWSFFKELKGYLKKIGLEIEFTDLLTVFKTMTWDKLSRQIVDQFLSEPKYHL